MHFSPFFLSPKSLFLFSPQRRCGHSVIYNPVFLLRIRNLSPTTSESYLEKYSSNNKVTYLFGTMRPNSASSYSQKRKELNCSQPDSVRSASALRSPSTALLNDHGLTFNLIFFSVFYNVITTVGFIALILKIQTT